MNLNLFLIPGALFLVVIFIRVVIPYLKKPAWQRMVDNARYYRHMEKLEKAEQILEKAMEKFPERPEVLIEYFLHPADAGDLKKRFEVLRRGFDRTEDTALGFFLGSGYLEDGDFPSARRYLDTEACRSYMVTHKIPLFSQLLYEEGNYDSAEREFLDFYALVFDIEEERESILDDLSAQDLILFVLILKAAGKDWKSTMNRIPLSGFHSDMSWKDYLAMLKEEYGNLKPARTGINGDPGNFNRRRKEYYLERMGLIESHLVK